jgi:tetraacyldisaccharide 4'-kinase
MRAPDFWTSRSAGAVALAYALSPFGALYDLGGRVRFAAAKPYRSPMKVICVGNLTAGGVGKTPIAIALAERLTARGIRCAFLSRGYGAPIKDPLLADPTGHVSADVGDEPLLLARHAPTIVSPDRVKGAMLAVQTGAQVLIMDDGFQNPSLAKDLSFVAVDGATGFGNGFVIPAGPLRESVVRGLGRAQAVIVMGDGPAPATTLPVLRARLEPSAEASARVKTAKVAAFAGIGRPEKFFATLRAAGANLVLARAFPDHYAFTAADWAGLTGEAAEYGAALVTTEKDWVRLKPEWRAKVAAFPVRAVFEDEAALDRLLAAHV